MTEQQEQPMQTLDQVLDRWRLVQQVSLTGDDVTALKVMLAEREDNALHMIRMAGEQYMALPQLTAKVLMDTGLGSPPDAETRAMVDQQFQMVVDHLRTHFGDEFGQPQT